MSLGTEFYHGEGVSGGKEVLGEQFRGSERFAEGHTQSKEAGKPIVLDGSVGVSFL